MHAKYRYFTAKDPFTGASCLGATLMSTVSATITTAFEKKLPRGITEKMVEAGADALYEAGFYSDGEDPKQAATTIYLAMHRSKKGLK